MKGKKGLNLFAVIVAVIFLLVYTLPTLRSAQEAEACAEQGGRYVHSENRCEN